MCNSSVQATLLHSEGNGVETFTKRQGTHLRIHLFPETESTLHQAEQFAQRLDGTTQQAQKLMAQRQQVGEQTTSFFNDVRRWTPWVLVAAALSSLLVSLLIR